MWVGYLSKHDYFGGLFSLEESLEGVQYAVFDDIAGGLKFFPQYKSWLGNQLEFYATDKYQRKTLVKWGKPCIWISNEYPITEGVDYDWMEQNCIFVEINSPLFS